MYLLQEVCLAFFLRSKAFEDPRFLDADSSFGYGFSLLSNKGRFPTEHSYLFQYNSKGGLGEKTAIPGRFFLVIHLKYLTGFVHH